MSSACCRKYLTKFMSRYRREKTIPWGVFFQEENGSWQIMKVSLVPYPAWRCLRNLVYLNCLKPSKSGNQGDGEFFQVTNQSVPIHLSSYLWVMESLACLWLDFFYAFRWPWTHANCKAGQASEICPGAWDVQPLCLCQDRGLGKPCLVSHVSLKHKDHRQSSLAE